MLQNPLRDIGKADSQARPNRSSVRGGVVEALRFDEIGVDKPDSPYLEPLMGMSLMWHRMEVLHRAIDHRVAA